MTTVSAAQIVDAARRQNKLLRDEVLELGRLDAAHRRALAAVDAEEAAAWENLVEVIVPALDEAALEALSRRLGLPAIGPAQVRQRAAEERARDDQAIREVDADPDSARAVDVQNEIAIEVDELDRQIAPLKEGVRALQDDRHFGELLSKGYGTPDYTVPYWTLSYYRHWKHGDLLIEQHGPRWRVKDFAALRAKYGEQTAALATLADARKTLRARGAAVEALLRRRADAVRSIETSAPRHLGDVRARVRAHIEPLDDERLVSLVARDEATRTTAARIAGVRAKRRYLQKMHEELVAAPREAIKRAIQKNESDAAKLSRPKNRNRSMAQSDFDRRFSDKRPTWEKRRRRYEDASNQVVVFHDYSRWNPVGDILWWDLMTDGRIDGDFIPEVQHHHATHGHYDRAATAVAQEQSFTSSDRFSDAS